MGYVPLLSGFFDHFFRLAGNGWASWPLLVLGLEILFMKNLSLILDFMNFADLKKETKGIEPNKPTIYRSAVGNWACWAKLISEVAQIQGPKRWIVCRHTTFQQLVYGDAALISFSGLDPINFVC